MGTYKAGRRLWILSVTDWRMFRSALPRATTQEQQICQALAYKALYAKKPWMHLAILEVA